MSSFSVRLLVGQVQHGELAWPSRLRVEFGLFITSERILDDGRRASAGSPALAFEVLLIVDLHLDILGDPLRDPPDTQLLDVEVVQPRIQIGLD